MIEALALSDGEELKSLRSEAGELLAIFSKSQQTAKGAQRS
jgi:hypothetical protein